MKTKKEYRDPVKSQYYLLVDFLDRTKWQLRGDCEDIDCDKYIYRTSLKKHHPTLEHSYSCFPSLQRQLQSLMALLSDKKFKRFRFKRCEVCANPLDTLDDKNPFSSFIEIEPKKKGKFKGYEFKSFRTHPRCRKLLPTPQGFKAF